MMLSTANLLSPSNGEPVVGPAQDMVLGCYYLTLEGGDDPGQGRAGALRRRAGSPARLRRGQDRHPHGRRRCKNHSVPRMTCTRPLRSPSRLGRGRGGRSPIRVVAYDGRPGDLQRGAAGSAALRQQDHEPHRAARARGGVLPAARPNETAHLVDGIKSVGFHYATRGGMTIAVDDIAVPAAKGSLLKVADAQVEAIDKQFQRGLITERRALRAGRRSVEEDHAEASAIR